MLKHLSKILSFVAKESVQATGEDTDAVHRRFMKEPSANIKDGVTEPSKVNIISFLFVNNSNPGLSTHFNVLNIPKMIPLHPNIVL